VSNKALKKNNKQITSRKGFTLAEILLALTIIGVISCLTIPALIESIQTSQQQTQWVKMFAVLDAATLRVRNDSAGDFTGYFANSDDMANRFLSYMVPAQRCLSGSVYGQGNCWINSAPAYLNGTTNTMPATGSGALLNNGATVVFNLIASACNDTTASTDPRCGFIILDINGSQGPNVI